MARHPKHIRDYDGSLDKLAKDMANLSYDKQIYLLEKFQEETGIFSKKDSENGKRKLSSELTGAVSGLDDVINHFKNAWVYSRPYMKRGVKAVIRYDDIDTICVVLYRTILLTLSFFQCCKIEPTFKTLCI
ncbi:hypothetical protein KY321_01305, partial [Candidatus Woesearchaeota archaeon]|nr:hypothetical protein [Candidatus Woesearchaeota archaeon]